MALNRSILKAVILDTHNDVEKYVVQHRDYDLDNFPTQIFIGVRRSGKSFLLFQKIHQLLSEGHKWSDMLYIDFEDRRLDGFAMEDFSLLLECHTELYGTRPILFLDEIQNIDGWQHFARNMADKKYQVYITGSNAKMLSREFMGDLGGRYLPMQVYPLSFVEYLQFLDIPYDEKVILATESRAKVMAAYNEYFKWGGLPETVNLAVKRSFLSSVYQKIYLGDIIARNKISNPRLLQLMLKKMAESIMQPISYNRLSRILSSIGGKVSVPTVSNYIGYAEDAWLLLRLHNIASAFSEKETVCKYYFVDNGLLSLQLLNANSILLENMVALSLFRMYGNDADNERVYFYNDNIEVDFYVPEDELAIQVSYSLADDATRKREVDALTKLPNVHPCRKRLIITYDETDEITDSRGTISVVPCWQWLITNKK